MTSVRNIVQTCSPSDLHRFLTNNSNCDWILAGKIGSGKYGVVYQVCCNGNCQFVAKHIKSRSANPETFRELVHKEVKSQYKLQQHQLAPMILEAFVCGDEAYIISEKKDMTIKDFIFTLVQTHSPSEARQYMVNLLNDTVRFLHRAYQLGFRHGDPHLENFMIDFGEQGGYQNIQMIDTSDIQRISKPSQQEWKEIQQELVQSFNLIYKEALRKKEKGSQSAIKSSPPAAPSKSRGSKSTSKKEEKSKTLTFDDEEEEIEDSSLRRQLF